LPERDRAPEAAMKPRRVQLRRTAGWRMPANTVSVARPTKWGNPWRIEEYRGEITDDDRRGLAVRDFEGELGSRIFGILPTIEEVRRELRGKNLACWCPRGKLCHADVLLEVANS
jgi:hypothetical protein